MQLSKAIPLNKTITVNGDGLWSSLTKQVRLTELSICYHSDQDLSNDGTLDEEIAVGDCASCIITFNTEDWDVETEGLIYTDSCEEEIKAIVAEAIGSPDETVVMFWSEQGMQGDDYLHFDITVDLDVLKFIS